MVDTETVLPAVAPPPAAVDAVVTRTVLPWELAVQLAGMASIEENVTVHLTPVRLLQHFLQQQRVAIVDSAVHLGQGIGHCAEIGQTHGVYPHEYEPTNSLHAGVGVELRDNLLAGGVILVLAPRDDQCGDHWDRLPVKPV